MEMTLKTLFEIVDELPGNQVVMENNNGSLAFLHHGCDVFALTGRTREELKKNASPFDMVLEDDREIIYKMLASFPRPGEKSVSLVFRIAHRTKGFIWVQMDIKQYAWIEGHEVFLADLVDVTKETMISYSLMEASDRSICVIEKISKRVLYGNSKFYSLIDAESTKPLGGYCYENLCRALGMTDKDDCLCYSSINADPPVEVYNAEKKRYLAITGRETLWGEYDAYVFYITDITERKQKDAALTDSQNRFNMTLENSDLYIWEYDIVNSRCINSRKAVREYSLPLVIENYPESLYDMGHTPPETIEQIKEVKRRLLNGETGFSVERRTINSEGKSQWMKVAYSLEKDLDGKPIRALVCAADITEQKRLEQRYEEEVRLKKQVQGDTKVLAILDLTKDCIAESAANEMLLSGFLATQSIDEIMERVRKRFVAPDDQDEYKKIFSREKMMRDYAKGITHSSFRHQVTHQNGWFESTFDTVRNPSSGNIEAIATIKDVSELVRSEQVVKTLMTIDYDSILTIDAETGEPRPFGSSSPTMAGVIAAQKQANDNVSGVESYLRSRCTDADIERIVQETELTFVVNKLKTQPQHALLYSLNEDGRIQRKRMIFAYLDKSHKTLLCARQDVTESYRQEEAQKAKLSQALKNAEIANRAKTDFLSRMSHDMRTPMNAIIGLSALTLDEANNPIAVRENMTKMRAASDFMLGLVNDILDTAKLEDGSVVLNAQPYTYFEFLSNMKTMFRPQCEAKGICLTIQPTERNPMVRVDKMRLNQIFFNILSNAVKYTPPGGRIDYSAENLKIEGKRLSADFVIRDTGIGMSEAYQKHLFEPFMQESSVATPELQGSGLGLTITKQLIDLMGGKIEITSKVNVGTTVRMRFSFECLEADAEKIRHIQAEDRNLSILAGKHILLAEDHPLNAQIARKLLENKDMLVTYAGNGKIALDRFRASDPYAFDLILMDIRMPELSGLEAARAIRALDRPDAKSVKILALSANAYEEDIQKSIEAGMNGHLAKPVEPKLLYQTLAKCFAENS